MIRFILITFGIAAFIAACTKQPEPATPPPGVTGGTPDSAAAIEAEKARKSKEFIENSKRSKQSKVEFDAAGNPIKQ